MQVKYLKRFAAFLLAAVILIGAVPVTGVFAAENDPSMGVDVSSWNGEIDWAAAAAQIDFAMLRIGSKSVVDISFERNAVGCQANAVDFGVYYVANALSEEEALAEAALVIDALEGHSPTLPVFVDVEYKLHNSLTSQQLQNVVRTFCDAIAQAGYQPGIYSYVELLDAHFSTDAFSDLPKWVSEIDVEQCSYTGEFVMWQYSWSGRVAGISGDVDCNYYYPPCEHAETAYSFADNCHVLTCAACGKVITKAAADGKKLGFNTASPALAVDIVMNISTTIPEGFADPYLVVDFNGVTTTVREYTVNAENGRYVFAFGGINPQTMGDVFTATLYARVGNTLTRVVLEYSMVKYINSQLKKSTISAELRTALSDLVMYGQANQVYEGYKTDALLSTLLEETAVLTPSTFTALDESYNKQSTAGIKDANIDLKGVTMALGSKVMVRMTVFCADPSAYTVKVTINGEEHLYPVSELALAAGYTDRYVVEFDRIRATQFGEVITFSFQDQGGHQVGRTLEYTVYSYVQKNQGSENADLANLLEAIYNYGESVKKI